MSRFDIELTEFSGEPPVDELARTFGIDVSTARALVQSVPRTVKRGVDEAEAERFFHALRELGAHVRLHRNAPSSRPPPSSPPASVPPPSVPPASAAPAPAAPGFAASDLPLPELDGPPAQAPGLHSSAPPPASAPPGAIPPASAVPAGSQASGPRVEQSALGEDRGGFVGNLVSAYVYPFQKALFAVALGIGIGSQLASYVPVVGGLLSMGIWISYVFAVIRHAALGQDGLPGTDDFEGFGDIMVPAIRFLLALLVPALLLGVLYVALSAGSASAETLLTGSDGFSLASAPLLFLVALGLWLLYLPASLILAAHSSGCLGGLNLVGGVMLMVREPTGYALTVAAAAPAAGMMIGAEMVTALVDQAVAIPFLPGALGTAVTLIPAVIAGRILGLFIWHHEHELGLG